MGFIAFVVDESGRKGGASFEVIENGASEYSRAVDNLRHEKALDDPATARMFAEHFAEVVISKHLAGDETAASKAAAALMSLLEQPYLMIEASRLRGDIEITRITPIDAKTTTEAELVWSHTLERMAKNA